MTGGDAARARVMVILPAEAAAFFTDAGPLPWTVARTESLDSTWGTVTVTFEACALTVAFPAVENLANPCTLRARPPPAWVPASTPGTAAAVESPNTPADSYAELGLRFDQARVLLTLGRAERRLKRWAAARRSLELAAAAFDEIGSTGWSARARSEIGRIGARRPGRAGELTPTERRVAELAATGRSNKEIARSLFVTINTVEGHLSHAYAKLGVRSRAQLAHRLGGQGAPGAARER